MNIILKHIGRNIRENKFRSVVIAFIVLLSTAVSFVVFHLQDIITYNYDKVYNASIGEANVTIQHNVADSPYLLENLNLDKVSVEKRSDIYQLTGKYDSGQSVIKVMLIGMNLDEYRNMDAVSLLHTQDDFTLHQGESVISKKSADQYGLSVGDSVSITIKEHDHVFKIAAIAESNRTFYEEKGNFQLLIPLEDANAINHSAGMATKTRLKVNDSAEMTDIVQRLQNQNSNLIVYEGEEFEALHYQLSTVSSVMFVVVMIIILIGIYIQYSLVKLIMMDRLPIIGTFRSVGANRTKIIGVLLLEFLSYGAIGTILGLLLAVPLLPIIADLFNQYKEFGVATEVTYNFGYGVAAACIGLFLPALSALFPIIKTSKIPLKDIILKPSSKLTETSTKNMVVAGTLLTISVVLFYINISDNIILGFISLICLICGAAFLTPIVMTMISNVTIKLRPDGGSSIIGLKNLKSNKAVRSNGSMLVVIILIVLMMATLTDGIKNLALTDIAASGYDVIVTLNEEKSIRAIDLQDIEGVDGAFDSYETKWFGDYSTGFSRVYGVGQFSQLNEYVQALRYDGDDFDEILSNTKHGIIIDHYWARVQNLSIGDILPMYADDQRTNKVGDFTIAGFWDSSKGTTDRGFVAISLADYKTLISDTPEKILIKTASADKVAQEIAEKYMDTNISAVTMDNFLVEQLTAIDTMIGILFASVFLGSIIIMFGVISNLVVSFIQRKKEYAVMYSVCMSKRQLTNMLLWEMVFSCIAIWSVSVVSGFALTKFLTKATSGTGLVLDFRFNPVIMLVIIITIFAIQAITTAFPIRKLKKLNMVEGLKYE